jgi:hypothetical protein
MTLRRVDFAGRPLLSVVWQDVTQSRLHADRIRRLNQAYAVLSGVNEAIVRLQDVAALQAEVCRIAVDVGGFGQAWIGRAQAGADTLLVGGPLPAEDGRQHAAGLGPCPRASGRLQVVTTSPVVAGRPRGAAGHGLQRWRPFRSRAGRLLTAACWCCRPKAPATSTPSSWRCYARLVRDVAHAIESIAAELARRQEQRLREQLMESVAGPVLRHRCAGPAADVEPPACAADRRRRPTRMRASHLHADFFAPDSHPAVLDTLARVMVDQEARPRLRCACAMAGWCRTCWWHAALDLDTGPVVVGTGIDISDRLRADRELAQHRQHLEQLVAQRTAELETPEPPPGTRKTCACAPCSA